MLVGNDLADAIRINMAFPAPTSAQLHGWGRAVVEHIQTAALVNHAPGLVTGTAPSSGGALSNGAAANGLISAMSGAVLGQLVVDYAYAGYGPGYSDVRQPLLVKCQQIVLHIQTLGRVAFASGNIVGSCTNTAGSPGSFTGTGSNGTISGLDGTILANAIHAAFQPLNPCYGGSVPTRLTQFCVALCTYIMANAVVTHTSCSGTAPAGGGGITAGTGTNGKIA